MMRIAFSAAVYHLSNLNAENTHDQIDGYPEKEACRRGGFQIRQESQAGRSNCRISLVCCAQASGQRYCKYGQESHGKGGREVKQCFASRFGKTRRVPESR